ncbi:MAG: tetratricopeptide repeat protein, partial [Pyrinomonadaceae bacterium]
SAGGKKNYLVHYYLAYLLSREHMDEFGMITRLPPETARRMRRGLAASIDLNPRFAESYKLLALVGLITGDDLDGALKFLDKAADLHPGNAEHSLLRAQVLMRLDRTDEARDAARLVLRTTVDRNQRARAAEIIRSADEYAAGLKVQKQNLLTVTAMGASDPIIFKRKDLTDDQIRKMDEDRDIANLNVLLDRSGPGEQTAVGYIEQIGCSNGRINYRIKTNTGVLNLSGKSFSDLKVKVLLAGTRSFSFSCGAEFSTELAALRFRPAASPTARDQGTLTALTFVPKNFRPMSYDEIAYNRRIIIEGRPASDLEKNARTSAAEIAEMERVERETRLKQIEERLRPPEADETRITGIAEKVLCSDGLLSVTVRSGERSLILQTPIMKMSKIEIQSLSPDAGLASLDCRSGLPPVNAVFTFTRRELSKSQYDEIVAIEFVPAAFKLP